MYVIANGGMVTHNIRNTMDAILLTKNASYVDGILLDIRLSNDDELVLMKHNDLSKDTLGKGNVDDYNYKELKKVKYPSKIFKYYMPTLKEALDNYTRYKIIVLELHDCKHKNSLLIDKVLSLLKKYNYIFYIETSSRSLLNELIIKNNHKYPLGLKIEDNLQECNNLVTFCDILYSEVNKNVNTYQEIMSHVINDPKELEQVLEQVIVSKLDKLLLISDNPKRIKEYLNKHNL